MATCQPTSVVERWDVVVVGGGGSGLAAAIEAAEQGRRTLLLEKNARLGGSTAWSVGSITATRTPHQLRSGIDDSPAWHWEDMPLFAAGLEQRDNAELRRILCDEVPATVRWLLEAGIRFHGPLPEPPHRLPRMHTVLPNSRSFIYNLARRARRVGVEIRLGANAQALINSSGVVRGVECTLAGRRMQLEAAAVVLAAGDFTNDPVFKTRFMGAEAAAVEGLNPTATGDGQRMGEALGATVLNGDLALGPELRFEPPARETLVRRLPPWRGLAWLMGWCLQHLPPLLLRPLMMRFLTTALAPSVRLFDDGALLINRQGERFCDECSGPAPRVAQQPGRSAYLLLDARIAARYSAWPNYISTAPGIAYAYLPDYARSRRDVYASAPTLEGIARMIGVAAANLTASIDQYNSTRGHCPATGGGADTRPRFGPGPYVALGPVRAVFVHSEGGLAVDDHHRVLNAAGRAIAGLYAAGSTGQGGLLLKGHGHHLAWAFTSGRRAGRFAAAWAASCRR